MLEPSGNQSFQSSSPRVRLLHSPLPLPLSHSHSPSHNTSHRFGALRRRGDQRRTNQLSSIKRAASMTLRALFFALITTDGAASIRVVLVRLGLHLLLLPRVQHGGRRGRSLSCYGPELLLLTLQRRSKLKDLVKVGMTDKGIEVTHSWMKSSVLLSILLEVWARVQCA